MADEPKPKWTEVESSEPLDVDAWLDRLARILVEEQEATGEKSG